MKKHLIFYLLSLIFITALPAGAVKKIEANPINIAFILAQLTDTAKMASILHYYGYEPAEGQFSERSFPTEGKSSLKTQDSRLKTEYTHPSNGSTIRYSFQDATEEQPYPNVEVKSKVTSKEEDSILADLQFKKEGSGYTRKRNQYSRTVFTCRHRPGGYLLFHQIRIMDSGLPRPLSHGARSSQTAKP